MNATLFCKGRVDSRMRDCWENVPAKYISGMAESLSSRDSTRNSRSVSLLLFESMSLDDVLAELCHHLQEGSMNSKLGPEFIFW